MQVRNDYDLDVYNGDVGQIESVDTIDQHVHVRFDDRRVTYAFDALDALTLAYAATVHKSQGSEYPVVVLGLHSQHHVMLQRNLLYTAVTRDQNGRGFIARSVLDRLVPLAHRPIFSYVGTFLGHGIVGGALVEPRTTIGGLAPMIARVASGMPATDIPVLTRRTAGKNKSRFFIQFACPISEYDEIAPIFESIKKSFRF